MAKPYVYPAGVVSQPVEGPRPVMGGLALGPSVRRPRIGQQTNKRGGVVKRTGPAKVHKGERVIAASATFERDVKHAKNKKR